MISNRPQLLFSKHVRRVFKAVFQCETSSSHEVCLPTCPHVCFPRQSTEKLKLPCLNYETCREALVAFRYSAHLQFSYSYTCRISQAEWQNLLDYHLDSFVVIFVPFIFVMNTMDAMIDYLNCYKVFPIMTVLGHYRPGFSLVAPNFFE